MLRTRIITAAQAHELIEGGGLNWIIFAGDRFDAELFADWTGYTATERERKVVDSLAAALTEKAALQVELDRLPD